MCPPRAAKSQVNLVGRKAAKPIATRAATLSQRDCSKARPQGAGYLFHRTGGRPLFQVNVQGPARKELDSSGSTPRWRPA